MEPKKQPPPKKEPSPFEEELILLKKEVSRMKAEREVFFNASRRLIENIEAKLMGTLHRGVKEIEKCNASMEKHREFLNNIRDSNENVEESLCNVLLAIRQNEYLQAWYPAQKGHPETKVVGVHPLRMKPKKEEENVS